MRTYLPLQRATDNSRPNKAAQPVAVVTSAHNPALKTGVVQALMRSEERAQAQRKEQDKKRQILQSKEAISATPELASDEESVAQCKTGFEIEMDVPAYMEPEDGKKPVLTGEDLLDQEEKDIQSFLAGGLKYGYKYGMDQDGFYTMTADHNAFSRKHSAFITKLHQAGKVQAFFYPGMTNIEYVTPPIEEATPDLFNDIGQAIQDHASNTATRAKSGQTRDITAPARALKTGVPKAALKKLVGDSQQLKSEIDTLSDAITGNAYYQQTSGLLPSEIQDFFDKAVEDIYDNASLELSLERSGLSQDQYEELSDLGQKQIRKFANRADVKEHKKREYAKAAMLGAASSTANSLEFPDNADANDAKQARGFFTVAAQYYLASQLEKYRGLYGGTSKNKVAFLSRVRLHQVRGALSPGAINLVTYVWGNNTRKQVFYTRANHFATYIRTAAGLNQLASNETNSEVLTADPQAELDKIMAGTLATHVAPGQSIDPEDVEDGTMTIDGQKMVPMEDRYMSSKMTLQDRDSGNIASVLRSRWEQIYGVRDESYSVASKQQIAEYRQLGLDKLAAMMSAAEYQLGTDPYNAIQGKLTALHPILLDPTSLDPNKVNELNNEFPDIDQLRLNLANGQLQEKKQRVATYMTTKVQAAIRTAIATKRQTDDSDNARNAAHASFEFNFAGLKGRATGRTTFTPTIKESNSNYFVIYNEKPKLIFNVGGTAAYRVDENTVKPVRAFVAGAGKSLRFASLGGNLVWV